MDNINQIRAQAPKGANKYSISTGYYYKFLFKGLISKKWNGTTWVDSITPADAERFKPLH